MDVGLARLLNGMDQESLWRLMVRRLCPGKYEVDGRVVSVRWSETEGIDATQPELVVREDDVCVEADEVPLSAYLQQAANVAHALRGKVNTGASAVTRIPQEKRLTFSTPGTENLDCLDVLQRCASMRKACEEAALRERAAEAYENGLPYFLPTKTDPVKA